MERSSSPQGAAEMSVPQGAAEMSVRQVIFDAFACKNTLVAVAGTCVLLDADRMDISQDGARLIVALGPRLDGASRAVVNSLVLAANVVVRGKVMKKQRRTYVVADQVELAPAVGANENAPRGDAELWHEATSAIFSSTSNDTRQDARGGANGDVAAPSAASSSPQPLRLLRAHELSVATAGFDVAHLIASGADGAVFQAVLPSLRSSGPCAIKRIGSRSADEASAEVALLAKCAPCPYLLPLLGYCLVAAPCLIFPLMSGGTLEDRIRLTPDGVQRLRALGHASAPMALTWWERVRTLRDVMRGLIYLHTECRTVHCDVKPSNILLDARGYARLADFGAVKTTGRSDPEVITRGAPSSTEDHLQSAAASPTAPRTAPPTTVPIALAAAPALPVYDDLDYSSPKNYSPTLPPSVQPLSAEPPAAPLTAALTKLAISPAASAHSSPLRATAPPPPPPAARTSGGGPEVEMRRVDVRLLHRIEGEGEDLPALPAAPPRTKHRVAPRPLHSGSSAGGAPSAGAPLSFLPTASSPLASYPSSPDASAAGGAPRLRPVDSFNWVLVADTPPSAMPSAATFGPPSLRPPSFGPPKAAGAAAGDVAEPLVRSPRTEAAGRKTLARTDEGEPADGPAGFVAGLCPTRPGQYAPPAKFVAGLRGTPDYIDPLYAQPGSVHSGKASAMTDGYALGVTILLTMTGLSSTALVHRCKDLLLHPDEPSRWRPTAAPAKEAGAWPPKVVRGLLGLVIGLTWEPRAAHRMPVDEAHRGLEALADTIGVDGGSVKRPSR